MIATCDVPLITDLWNFLYGYLPEGNYDWVTTKHQIDTYEISKNSMLGGNIIVKDEDCLNPFVAPLGVICIQDEELQHCIPLTTTLKVEPVDFDKMGNKLLESLGVPSEFLNSSSCTGPQGLTGLTGITGVQGYAGLSGFQGTAMQLDSPPGYEFLSAVSEIFHKHYSRDTLIWEHALAMCKSLSEGSIVAYAEKQDHGSMLNCIRHFVKSKIGI